MTSESKYELLYRAQGEVCGAPFPEYVAFAEAHSNPSASILDLGCGQGRDALVFARRGMSVVGVDISPTGIEQMLAIGKAEGLQLTGVVSDINEYEPEGSFDVILIDRTLHMLPDPNDRLSVLSRCADWVTDSGHILIADEPRNIRVFVDWFAADSREWKQEPKMKRGFCFVQKVVG